MQGIDWQVLALQRELRVILQKGLLVHWGVQQAAFIEIFQKVFFPEPIQDNRRRLVARTMTQTVLQVPQMGQKRWVAGGERRLVPILNQLDWAFLRGETEDFVTYILGRQFQQVVGPKFKQHLLLIFDKGECFSVSGANFGLLLSGLWEDGTKQQLLLPIGHDECTSARRQYSTARYLGSKAKGVWKGQVPLGLSSVLWVGTRDHGVGKQYHRGWLPASGMRMGQMEVE